MITVMEMRRDAGDLKDSLLIALSSLALVPVIAGLSLLFNGQPGSLLPLMTPGPKRSLPPVVQKPAAVKVRVVGAEAAPSARVRPDSPLKSVSDEIAKFWDTGRHGAVEQYLADGKVRVVIRAWGNATPANLNAFWRSTCNDSSVRYVVVLPHGVAPPQDSENVVFVALDEVTTAGLGATAFVIVVAQHGQLAHNGTYTDFGQLQAAVHAAVQAAQNLGAEPSRQPVPVQSQVQAAVVPPSPPPAVQPSPAPPAPANGVITATRHTDKPATKPSAEKPETKPSKPPVPPPPAVKWTSLNSLDARLQPLFQKQATSLLKLPEVRKARSRSKPVVLCFWATYCAPCVAELSELSAISGQHKEVAFVGLLQDSDLDDVRALALKMVPEDFHGHYFLADGLLQNKIFHSTQIPLPAFAVFDGQGHMRDAFIGSLLAKPENRERLMAWLQSKD